MNPFAPKEPAKKRAKRKPRTHITVDHPQHGKIEIRSMKGVQFGEACHLLTETGSDPAAPVWIQIAKQGRFLGHAAGPFEMNVQTFEDIIRNFKAHPEEIPCDFEHASESDASLGTIPTHGAPAQGWVKDLKIEAGNLFGLVEWGDLARSYIKEGKYKYLSPAVRLGSKDRVSGKPIGARLSSIALTNSPFLSGMQQVAAKHTEGEEDAEETELDDDVDDNDLDPASAEESHPIEGEDDMDIKELEAKLAVANDKLASTESKLSAADKTLAAKEAEIGALKAEHTSLMSWKQDRENKDAVDAVEEAFDVYKDDRKLTDSNKASMLTLMKAAPVAFLEMYPKVEPAKRHLLRSVAAGTREAPAAAAGPAAALTKVEAGNLFVSMKDALKKANPSMSEGELFTKADLEFRAYMKNRG